MGMIGFKAVRMDIRMDIVVVWMRKVIAQLPLYKYAINVGL